MVTRLEVKLLIRLKVQQILKLLLDVMALFF